MDDSIDLNDTTAANDWARIEGLFPTRLALIPNSAWLNGMSSRVSKGRLSRLTGSPQSGRLAALLDQCSDGRIKALRTYAAVNLEQAASAFRVTMIANITAPVVFLSVAHQLIDGGLGSFLSRLVDGDDLMLIFMIGLSATVATLVLLMAFYALGSLNHARDIRHLIDLHAADRGIYFGLEDIEDLHSP